MGVPVEARKPAKTRFSFSAFEVTTALWCKVDGGAASGAEGRSHRQLSPVLRQALRQFSIPKGVFGAQVSRRSENAVQPLGGTFMLLFDSWPSRIPLHVFDDQDFLK